MKIRFRMFWQTVLVFLRRYDEYRVVCSLHHGSRQIGEDVVSQTTTNQKELCDWLNWNQWSVSICVPNSWLLILVNFSVNTKWQNLKLSELSFLRLL